MKNVEIMINKDGSFMTSSPECDLREWADCDTICIDTVENVFKKYAALVVKNNELINREHYFKGLRARFNEDAFLLSDDELLSLLNSGVCNQEEEELIFHKLNNR